MRAACAGRGLGRQEGRRSRRRSPTRAQAMLDETEDEYRRLLYVAMTRAADRLIVGGCMPGNMNSVRKFSWYDLIGKGLENSGLQLQETRDRRRPGEALFAAGGCVPRPPERRGDRGDRADRAAVLAAHAGAAGSIRRQPAAPLRSRRRRRPAGPDRRIDRAARPRAAARHAGASAAAIAARSRRRAPPRRRADLSRPQCRRLDRRRARRRWRNRCWP